MAKESDLIEAIEILGRDLRLAKLEAVELCLAIYREHYREESPNFELCDSVAGIIGQISNMVTGLDKFYYCSVCKAKLPIINGVVIHLDVDHDNLLVL